VGLFISYARTMPIHPGRSKKMNQPRMIASQVASTWATAA
jgi:hypothetical protein